MQRKESSCSIIVETANQDILVPEQVGGFRNGAVADPQPEDLGWAAVEHAPIVEVGVLAGEEESVAGCMGPNAGSSPPSSPMSRRWADPG